VSFCRDFSISMLPFPLQMELFLLPPSFDKTKSLAGDIS
jgi:hypothetical protein